MPVRPGDDEEIFDRTRRVVHGLFQYGFLEGWSEPSIEITPHTDAGTSALMMRVQAHLQLIVKVPRNPQDIANEAQGYAVLHEGPKEFSRYLVPPLPIAADTGNLLWLTPLLNAHTLYTELWARQHSGENRLSDKFIADLYADVLAKMRLLWTTTRTEPTAELQGRYLTPVERAFEALERHIEAQASPSQASNFWDLQVEVNDRTFGSLQEIRDTFRQRVAELVTPERLPSACTTHGDEHPKNIMVERHVSDPKTAWALVDFANAARHSDWVLSIAKMLYWWRYFCVVERAKSDGRFRRCRGGSMRPDGNRLLLAYDDRHIAKQVPPLASRLERMVSNTAVTIGRQFGESERSWRARLQLALFATAFGSSRRQYESAEFAAPVLIGEALKALYDP